MTDLDKPLYAPPRIPVGYIIVGSGLASWAILIAFGAILVMTVLGV